MTVYPEDVLYVKMSPERLPRSVLMGFFPDTVIRFQETTLIPLSLMKMSTGKQWEAHEGFVERKGGTKSGRTPEISRLHLF